MTGTNAEAISMFNAVGCTVEKNIARTDCKLKGQPYSDAVHLILMGKNKITSKYKNTITKNTAYGNYYGIEVNAKKSVSMEKQRFPIIKYIANRERADVCV